MNTDSELIDINDGGPAFPSDSSICDNPGLSLRDHFAGQMLASMLLHSHYECRFLQDTAREAVLAADTLIAELAKGAAQPAVELTALHLALSNAHHRATNVFLASSGEPRDGAAILVGELSEIIESLPKGAA